MHPLTFENRSGSGQFGQQGLSGLLLWVRSLCAAPFSTGISGGSPSSLVSMGWCWVYILHRSGSCMGFIRRKRKIFFLIILSSSFLLFFLILFTFCVPLAAQ
jgi:hypothetical protein